MSVSVYMCACGPRIAEEGCLLPLSSLNSEEESNVTTSFHGAPFSHDPKMSFPENIHCLLHECICLQVTELLSSKQNLFPRQNRMTFYRPANKIKTKMKNTLIEICLCSPDQYEDGPSLVAALSFHLEKLVIKEWL